VLSPLLPSPRGANSECSQGFFKDAIMALLKGTSGVLPGGEGPVLLNDSHQILWEAVPMVQPPPCPDLHRNHHSRAEAWLAPLLEPPESHKEPQDNPQVHAQTRSHPRFCRLKEFR
jgi:hypothetical protein